MLIDSDKTSILLVVTHDSSRRIGSVIACDGIDEALDGIVVMMNRPERDQQDRADLARRWNEHVENGGYTAEFVTTWGNATYAVFPTENVTRVAKVWA